MIDGLRTLRGVVRSLRIYYGNPRRKRSMDRLHSCFVKPGDLVFDIGSHVGDRIASFRRLGCDVVAAEPQPALIRVLRLLYGRDRHVTILPAAIGASLRPATLMINVANPTITTASSDFVAAAAGAPGWAGERWTRTLTVPLTTLDTLIAEHGVPSFIKIDVEGYEADALTGLSVAVPSLSFEFTTIQRDMARRCLSRCAELGFRRFNAALGESQAFVHSTWLDHRTIARWLDDLPYEANSGDIYATGAAGSSK